jgi:hypothetical protein
MALTVRDATKSGVDVAQSSAIRAVAAKKPKAAKGTGKAPATVKKAHKGAGGVKKPYAYVPAAGAAAKPKKAAPTRQLTMSVLGPGKITGITCNGEELFVQVDFVDSFTIADGCIRVDGHVLHKYKITDKIAIGNMTCKGLLGMN